MGKRRRDAPLAREWKREEWAYKPGSVVGNHLSRPCVTARLKRATRTHGRAAVERSYLRLLQMGFAKPRRYRRAGALLPHRFSFSLAQGEGVFFSVALSVGSPRPAVSWHLALWSPDFPHVCTRDCPAHSADYSSRWHHGALLPRFRVAAFVLSACRRAPKKPNEVRFSGAASIMS